MKGYSGTASGLLGASKPLLTGWRLVMMIFPMSQTIHDILTEFRQEKTSNRELGDKFERLTASFLTKNPLYAELYSNVWLSQKIT